MKFYESEYTKFMREWRNQHSEQIEEAIKGRALWWDKNPVDLELQRNARPGNVARKAYYYDAN